MSIHQFLEVIGLFTVIVLCAGVVLYFCGLLKADIDWKDK